MDTTTHATTGYGIIADMLGVKLAEAAASSALKGIPTHKSDEVALLLDMVFELSVALDDADREFSSAQWDYRIGKAWREHSID